MERADLSYQPDMSIFYDDLAPLYHLLFQDWDSSVARQGNELSRIIKAEWPDASKVLDVSCGIGTQAIGLAKSGYTVVGSDLSADAIMRARREASRLDVVVAFSESDMRNAHAHHGSGFDVVISADNSLPHLLTDEEILLALQEMRACAGTGGGCLITVRDYELEKRDRHLVKPYRTRIENGKRYLPLQVWDFESDHYDMSLFIVEEELASRRVVTHVMRSRYYAIPITRLLELMRQTGFQNVRRIDGAFYQPVLVGTIRD